MAIGKEYGEGTVNFDSLMVLGKEFIAAVSSTNTNYYDYAFKVTPNISSKKRKKGEPECYDYYWSGHFNIDIGNKIHLHNVEPDVGLEEMEKKLQLVKETIDEFIKKLKDVPKNPLKKNISVKKWLNPDESRYTGHIAYHMEMTGESSFSIADCQRSNNIWLYAFKDKNGKPTLDGYTVRCLKNLEEIGKGAGKAVRAIQQLRKFFEREVFDSPLEK